MRSKDHDEPRKKTSIVYTIPCKDCSSNYVGQSSRKLETRIAEHQADIRRFNPNSQIAEHANNLDHRFAFLQARIVDYMVDLNMSALLRKRGIRMKLASIDTLSSIRHTKHYDME